VHPENAAGPGRPFAAPPLSRRQVVLALLAGLWRPVAAQAAAPTRVVVLSDFNESYGSTRYNPAIRRAVARTIALRPDVVLSTGDMVAGQRLAPPLGRPALEAMWAAFHDHVTTPLAAAGLGLAVTPGNHDASSGARFALERQVFREQWLRHRPVLDYVDDAHYPLRYAFRAGGALFVSLDATHVGHVSTAEREWLARLLSTEGRRMAHRVVFSHVPLWPFAVGRERDALADPMLEAVLQHGAVGLHLSGHHHAYFPGFKDGVRYVSQGCLGAAPRALLGMHQRSARTITVIELGADGQAVVEAYGGDHFDEPVPRQALPERIMSRAATLVRDDLAGAAGRR